MAKARVQKWGTNAYVEIDTAATIGATVGTDLRWSDGTPISEAELRAVSQVPDAGQEFTYWRLIREVPPNLTALAETETTGFYVVTADGVSTTRVIEVRPGELTITNGDGLNDDPTFGLADVPDAGGGQLQRTEFDAKGRRTGTSDATTDHLVEGEANLYFAAQRARAAAVADVIDPDVVDVAPSQRAVAEAIAEIELTPGPPGKDGQIRYTGIGPPPAVIVGANPGDTYMDLATGDVFKLT